MAPNRRSGPSSSNNSENPDVATVITQQLQAIITQVANNTNNANNGNNGGGNGNDGNTDVLLRHSNLAIPRSTMGKVRYITGLAPEIRGMLRATQPTTILTAILRAGILTDEAVSCGTLTKGSDKRKGVEEPSKTGGFWKDNKKEKTGTGFVVTAPTRNETVRYYPSRTKFVLVGKVDLNSGSKFVNAVIALSFYKFKIQFSQLKLGELNFESKSEMISISYIWTKTSNEQTHRFVQYTGIEVQHFRDTLLQHLGKVFKTSKLKEHSLRQYERRVNKRQMQTQESKIDTGKALDADLVDTESIRTDSKVQDDSSRSGNDTDADDADIRPIYDEEPMAEVQLTAECNIFAIGQQHTEQPEIIVEGQHGQILNETSNKAKIEKEIDVLETMNIELEHSVATLHKNRQQLANNAELKAQIQEKVFAIAALKNDLRKLKGNSVDTKFDKTSVLGKPVLPSLRNQSVVRQPNAFKSERAQMSKQRYIFNPKKGKNQSLVAEKTDITYRAGGFKEF
ncbi:hypothetical protein Tco_1502953 [Tanacetum coccineum]